MLKDDLPPKEPAREKATRKWRNHDVEKRFKEEKAKAVPIAPKELEVGDVIENKQRLAGSVIRAQTKFAEQLTHHAGRTYSSKFVGIQVGATCQNSYDSNLRN